MLFPREYFDFRDQPDGLMLELRANRSDVLGVPEGALEEPTPPVAHRIQTDSGIFQAAGYSPP
jgi:hypothetical protein